MQTDHLYIRVADRIEQMIAEKVWKTGDRLPSVRMLSKEQGVSLSTAFQAYYLLEGKGMIESRPKSGYYVRIDPALEPGVPAAGKPISIVERAISNEEIVTSVYKDFDIGEAVNLSLAAPPPELLPIAKLNKSVVHALRSHKSHCIGYEQIQGNLDLRKQIARLAFNWGGQITPDDIVVTSGCMEALVLCLKAVTQPGDTVAIESPTYFGIFQAIRSLGLKIVEAPTDPKNGVIVDELEAILDTHDIKACLFVPNFNNPLGSCMPDDQKKRLVELLTRRQILLIEDDIYGELYFGKHRPRTCKSYDREGIVLQCSSLSKSLAPGYRVGWAIPGPRYLAEVNRLKLIHSVTSATLPQVAMAHFLENGRYEYHLKAMRKALHTQSLRYRQAIQEYFPAGTRMTCPEGGMVLWIELDPKIDAFQLYNEALRRHVSIAPGQMFSVHTQYRHYIRVSFSRLWDAQAEEGIRVLGALVSEMS